MVHANRDALSAADAAPESHLLLRLAGDAFVVCQVMEPRRRFSLAAIKNVLYAALALLGQSAAYECFGERRLELGKSNDLS